MGSPLSDAAARGSGAAHMQRVIWPLNICSALQRQRSTDAFSVPNSTSSLVPSSRGRVKLHTVDQCALCTLALLCRNCAAAMYPLLPALALLHALLNISLRFARNSFVSFSSSVAVGKASCSPGVSVMETTGVSEPDARIKQVRRSLSAAGIEWHSRTRSKSPD